VIHSASLGLTRRGITGECELE